MQLFNYREIEKLKLSEMTCRQGVIEVAKMWVFFLSYKTCFVFFPSFLFDLMDLCRIYGVHDEAKDKTFELEMSWVCDESNRQHQKVTKPNQLFLFFIFIIKSNMCVCVCVTLL